MLNSKYIFPSLCFAALMWLVSCGKIQSESQKKGSDSSTYTLDDVKSVLQSQIRCWSNGDIDGFMDGYIRDSSVRFVTSKKVKSSWSQILSDYKKGYPTKEAMGNLDFLLDEVRWLDSAAGLSQVIGRWQVIQEVVAAQMDRSSDNSGSTKHASGSNNAVGSKNSMGTNPIQGHGLDLKTTRKDTLSGRFSLIFRGTPKGPKIAIDCTW